MNTILKIYLYNIYIKFQKQINTKMLVDNQMKIVIYLISHYFVNLLF